MSQAPQFKHIIPRLKSVIIGNVPYLLINDYLEASLNSKTHDYKDKVYFNSTINAALACEKATINSLNGPLLGIGFKFYGDALISIVKQMLLRAFKTRYPDLPLPKLEKYEEKGAFDEVAELIFSKLANELGSHYDKGSIEAMARLSAAELLLQVYIKFFEDLGVLKVMY